MPTTKIKNIAYRMLLPFMAPTCVFHPISFLSGHELNNRRSFESLLRRHHVLGSCVLLTSDKQKALICTASASPKHEAFPETYFRVASITKMATAILSMKFCDAGILDPDLPVGEYFPFPAARSALEGIRLRHLHAGMVRLRHFPDDRRDRAALFALRLSAHRRHSQEHGCDP